MLRAACCVLRRKSGPFVHKMQDAGRRARRCQGRREGQRECKSSRYRFGSLWVASRLSRQPGQQTWEAKDRGGAMHGVVGCSVFDACSPWLRTSPIAIKHPGRGRYRREREREQEKQNGRFNSVDRGGGGGGWGEGGGGGES